MTQRPTNHVLIWRSPNTDAGDLLLRWQEYRRSDAEPYFRKCGEPSAIRHLVDRAVCFDGGAIARGADVTVAWDGEDPETTSAEILEARYRTLQPVTVICPERPNKGNQWTIASHGAPQSLPAGAVQRVIDDLVRATFPQWAPRMPFQRHALMLRNAVSAEELGLVEPEKVTADMICAACAEDPEVAAATGRLDRATPSTWRDLVRARLAAQTRAGIAAADFAPLYSGQCDELVIAPIMAMGRGDEAATLATLRRTARRLFGDDLAEIVLMFALGQCQHDGAAKLLAFSTRKEAA
jgi:hypothetical protein